MIDHGIHVPRADGEEQARLAERLPCVARTPVRLTDDADSKTTRLQSSPQNGHGEAGMIDVSIASNDHDVHLVPTAFLSFCPCHRQSFGVSRSAILELESCQRIGIVDGSIQDRQAGSCRRGHEVDDTTSLSTQPSGVVFAAQESPRRTNPKRSQLPDRRC